MGPILLGAWQMEMYSFSGITCGVCYYLQDGASSLMLASKYGHVEVVDKLLQQGARVDLQNKVSRNVISLL